MDRFELTNDWLKERTSLSPKVTALFIDGRPWTFEQLEVLVSRFGHYLHENRIVRGNYVGMLMPNALPAVCCIFALGRIGATLVTLNTRLTPKELGWQIENAGCSAILCTTHMEEMAVAATQGQISVHALPQPAVEFEAVLAPYPTRFDPIASGSLTSLQAIVFTSGTTGFPKGAVISYANQYWSASGSAARLGTQANDRWLSCLPLYHVGGLAVLFRSCLYGTAVVLQDGFDVQAVLDSLREEAVTLVSLVPTMLGRLLQAGLSRANAQSLRLILLGGASTPPRLLAEATEAGLPIAVTYGLTETTSQVATMEPDRALLKPGSVGKPLALATITIVDDSGRDLPQNTPGEIVITGPMVMNGYFNDPSATIDKLRNGRLHTGDIGYLDDEGDLWVMDRRSDLIVSGGENVYPAEVERILQEYPEVSQVCVIGLPHPEWGQQVTAVIVSRSPGQFDEGDLLAFSRTQLAGYKQPKVIFIVDQLPQTGSGKINRRAVAVQMASRLAAA